MICWGGSSPASASASNLYPERGWLSRKVLTAAARQAKQPAAINAAWESVFTAEGHLPARTAVGVNALPLHAAVEMEFSFYKES